MDTNSKKLPEVIIKLKYGDAITIAAEVDTTASTVRSVISRYNAGDHIYSELGKSIIEKALAIKEQINKITL